MCAKFYQHKILGFQPLRSGGLSVARGLNLALMVCIASIYVHCIYKCTKSYQIQIERQRVLGPALIDLFLIVVAYFSQIANRSLYSFPNRHSYSVPTVNEMLIC